MTASEMKKMDTTTSEYYGMDSMILMERAALCVTEVVKGKLSELTMKAQTEGKACRSHGRVLVVAGCGNNGGDGIAVARLLGLDGILVSLFTIEGKKYSENYMRQLKIYEKYGLPCTDKIDEQEYDIIVDAILGVGINRPAEGAVLEAIQAVNRCSGYKIAVDLPSGIDSDTGAVLGEAIHADATVALGFYKRGQLIYEGRKCSGELMSAGIGITIETALGELPHLRLMRNRDVRLPDRQPNSNKGTCGKVVVVAGSPSISGAAILTARAVLRSGAGMVKVITPIENRTILATAIPEALLCCYDNAREQTDMLKREMEWGDVILAGPGIGMGTNALDLVRMILTETDQPLILDADALNLIADREDLEGLLTESAKNRDVILTPHLMEFARLMKLDRDNLRKDIFHFIEDYSRKTGTVLVVKDARTILCEPQDGQMILTWAGNSMLATAGTGDVLAGLMAGFVAQNRRLRAHMENGVMSSAANAVMIHGLTAERISMKMKNEYSGMAGDLCDALSETIGEYTK